LHNNIMASTEGVENDAPVLIPVGMDLGSLYARVAVAEPSGIQVASNAQGSRYTLALCVPQKSDADAAEPSFLFGEAARKSLVREKQSVTNHLVRKLLLESSKAGEEGEERVRAFWRHLSELTCDATSAHPSQLRCVLSLSAAVDAERLLQVARGGVVEAALQSCAAHGKKIKRKDLEALPLVLGVLDDASAICVAHGLTAPQTHASALVVDWGASGLTATRVHVQGGMLHVVDSSSSGSELGGEAFVELLMGHCASQFDRKNRLQGEDKVLESKRAKERLRAECDGALRTLSRAGSVTVTIDGLHQGLDMTVPVSKPRFDMLCNKLLQQAETTLQKMSFHTTTENQQLPEVVLLAGNVSCMPAAQALVEKLFPTAARGRSDVPSDEAVAIGCAVHAKELLAQTTLPESPDISLADIPVSPIDISVCPLMESDTEIIDMNGSAGIDMTTLIGKGTPLPAHVTQVVNLSNNSNTNNDNGKEDEKKEVSEQPSQCLAICQTNGKVLSRIEGIPSYATSVELTMELTVEGKLTVAVNGGDSITI
jgi:heat shock protein 1/8